MYDVSLTYKKITEYTFLFEVIPPKKALPKYINAYNKKFRRMFHTKEIQKSHPLKS